MKKVKHVLIHFLVWTGYFNLIAWSMSNFQDWQDSAVRALIVVLIHAFLFYLNANFLMPRFLDKRRVATYALLLVFSMGIVLALLAGPIKTFLPVKDPRFPKHMMEMEARKPRPKNERFLDRNLLGRKRRFDPRAIGIIISSAAVLFVSSVYFNVKNRKSKDEEMLQLKNQSLEAEKKFLKSQINPHFLFNTLNNLYSLASQRSEKTADAIQQLSEILRYTIYDSESKWVTLQKELEYIRHYIKLQSLKDDGFAERITLETKSANERLQIPPMLLLPFIENAFKHGDLATSEDSFLHISISSIQNSLRFVCENTITAASQAKDKTGGIGLKNVRRRLELIYGTNFSLDIRQSSDTFLINLELST